MLSYLSFWRIVLCKLSLTSVVVGVATGFAIAQSDTTVCLITKNDTNPFFVKMKEGATAKATELRITLKSYAGKVEGDSESQVAAIESCIADGAKGILITASDTKGIVPTVMKARDAGLLVIALDTPLDPLDSADATFATDNLEAGKLIGAWAAATLGDKAKDAKIGFLDLTPDQPTVDVLRDQGFMIGFGIDTKDVNKIGDEDDPRIVGHDVTNDNEEGGRKAMENLLLRDRFIDVVMTTSDLATTGIVQALDDQGLAERTIVSAAGGSCLGVKAVQDGKIDASLVVDSRSMGSLGVQAVANFIRSGEKPRPSVGKDFFALGVMLVVGPRPDDQPDPICETDPLACNKIINVRRAATFCDYLP